MAEPTERVFHSFSGAAGPIHLIQDGSSHDLSWCGAKRQFRHVARKGTRSEVTCKKCLKQIAENRPLAWGGT